MPLSQTNDIIPETAHCSHTGWPGTPVESRFGRDGRNRRFRCAIRRALVIWTVYERPRSRQPLDW